MRMASRQHFPTKKPDILISVQVDLGENARRDMVLTLEDMGYDDRSLPTMR